MSENSNKKVSQALRSGDDCPSLEELIELTGKHDRNIEAHVGGCAHCTTELALFRGFLDPALRPEEKSHVEAIAARLRENSPVPSASWWKSLWSVQWLAPASVAMAAILVGLFVWAPGRSGGSGVAPVISGGDDAMRSARVEIVSPVGTLLDAPAKLEWVAVRGAARYQVSLTEVDHTAVWSETVADPLANLPAEVRAKVVPRKTFLFEVKAMDAKGAVIAESGSHRFVMERIPTQ